MKQSKWTYNINWDEIGNRGDNFKLKSLTWVCSEDRCEALVLIDAQGYMTIVQSETSPVEDES